MKKVILTTSIACAIFLFTVIGCKKSGDTIATTDTSLQSAVTQNAIDQATLQNDDDAIANDVTKAVETVPKFALVAAQTCLHIGTFGADSFPPRPGDSLHFPPKDSLHTPPPFDSMSCPGIVIDRNPIIKGLRRIILHFRGMRDGFGMQKKGTVTVTLLNATRWDTIGAVLQEKDSLTVTGRDGKTRTYVSVRLVTNKSGGSLNSLAPSIFSFSVHTTGTITYSDGTVHSYWIYRVNTFNKLTKLFSIAGDSTVNNVLTTMGGSSRLGKTFIVNAPIAITADSACGYNRPKVGIRTLISEKDTVGITYGVDGTGTPIKSGCADFYKVNWTKLNGQKGTLVLPY